MKEEDKKTNPSLFEWVKAVCTLALVGVFTYKVYVTPIDLKIDFPTLLSLLLALFSVGLAALFYFKATEKSSTFYDNTYNFTKDIAQLLIKIESGFGERLRHLDEGYSSMRDQLQQRPSTKSDDEVAKTKKRIEEEKQELEKTLAERDEILGNLIEHSQLQEEEKENVIARLKEKENEVEEAQHQLEKMNRRLTIERMERRRMREGSRDKGFESFTRAKVVRKLGIDFIRENSPSKIRRAFDELLDDLPNGYIEDLEKYGYFDDSLNLNGIKYLSHLAEEADV